MSIEWHVDDRTIDAYVDARIDDAMALSLEAHLLACDACRRTLAGRTDPEVRRRSWEAIEAEIRCPRRGAVERSLTALGIPGHLARILVATPVLRASWFVSVAICLGFALLASRAVAGDPVLFLVLAPLVPLAGIATSFGRGADPLFEVGLAAPLGGFRLMLLRSAAVLVTSIVLAGVGSLALAGDGPVAAAWLVPALGLTVLALALSSFPVPASGASGVVAAIWVVGVVAGQRLTGDALAVFGATGQVLLGAVAIVSTVVIAVRHAMYERPTSI